MTSPLASTDNSRTRAMLRRGLLLGILCLAALLRLRGLGHQCFWYDEVQVLHSERVPLKNVLETVSIVENSPPLYFVVMNVWGHAFGDSEFPLRLPSAIFGVAGVAVIYLLGRRLGIALHRTRDGTAVEDSSRRLLSPADCIGLIAAMLLAISRFHIAYSQEARPYSLMFLLALISCYYFLRLIEPACGNGPHPSPHPNPLSEGEGAGAQAILSRTPPAVTSRWRIFAVAYVLSSAAMLWTHPFSVFVLVAQNAAFFPVAIAARLRGQAAGVGITTLRQWFVMQASIVVLFGAWFSQMVQVARTAAMWIPPPDIGAAALTYADSIPLLIVLSVLIIIALAQGWKRRSLGVLFALLVCVLPVAVPILASTSKHYFFCPRYGMTTLIGIYLLAACGIVALRQTAKALSSSRRALHLQGVIQWAIVALICGLAFGHLSDDFCNQLNLQRKADIRVAVRQLTSSPTRNDAVIFEDPLLNDVFRAYCHRPDLVYLRSVPSHPGSKGTSLPPRLWIVADSKDSLNIDRLTAGTPYHVAGEQSGQRIFLLELVAGKAPQTLREKSSGSAN